jgi:ABC-type multidrug transport system fused ATPase/permease subunit
VTNDVTVVGGAPAEHLAGTLAGVGSRVASAGRTRGRRSGPSTAAELVFDRATKVYGDHAPAVDMLSLTVPAGQICVLVGPAGKRQDDDAEARQPKGQPS